MPVTLLTLLLTATAPAAEVVWLTPPDDASAARVATVADAQRDPMEPLDLRAAAAAWSSADDEAYRALDAALRDVRTYETRLDGELLREIALRTEGVYVPAGTSALDLDSIIETHIEPMVTDSSTSITRRVPVEYYRWFVLAALATLVAATWLGATTGEPRRQRSEP